ncbi:MAG TPA: MFS transporter [Mycobacteriales bacterium]|nr:MFS transporter [Mycobacteriales bacterium]
MKQRGHLRGLLAAADFRRLLAVRLTAQAADGIFQASLAGAVLFNPERAASPGQVASALAVLLLPYSFVGPFAGVLLDRWSRQRILVVANLIRVALVLVVATQIGLGDGSAAFYFTALLTISVSRFFLAGLSAALPRIVGAAELVTANSFSTTLGTAATTIGAGAAVLIRSIAGNDDHGYAAIAACSAIGYALSAFAARRFGRTLLGPSTAERRARESVRDVLTGLVAGIAHLRQRPAAAHVLTAVAAQRFCYGLTTMMGILLYRNYFHGSAFLRAGLAGLAQLIAVGAAGSMLAAVVTPATTRRIGKPTWIVLLLFSSGVVELALGALFAKVPLLAAAFLLGFTAQGIKISVDTTVQESIEDTYRGRVFSVYDTIFNVTYVLAAVAGAVWLPETGKSFTVLSVITAVYLLTAAGFGTVIRRGSPQPEQPHSSRSAHAGT